MTEIPQILPDFELVISSDGITTRPHIGMVESRLSIVAKKFTNGQKPWRLIMSPSGEVKEINGFPGMDLQLGEIVGTAVHEFMSTLDGGYIEEVKEMAIEFASLPFVFNKLNWQNVQFEFVYPNSNRAEIMVMYPFFVRVRLPGVPFSPYRSDVQEYLKSIFILEAQTQHRRQLGEKFFNRARDFLDIIQQLTRAGIPVPENMARFLDSYEATNVDVRNPRALAEARKKVDALVGQTFPEIFPELVKPAEADVLEKIILQLNCRSCGQEGVAGMDCSVCGVQLSDKEEVFAEAEVSSEINESEKEGDPDVEDATTAPKVVS